MVCTDYPQQKKNSLLLAKKAISSIDNTNALVQQMDLFLQFLDRNWLVYPKKIQDIFTHFYFRMVSSYLVVKFMNIYKMCKDKKREHALPLFTR